ncbi:MAG TPA: PP2C family protein-serine/threonine phosphatase, partial [Anaerolineae bacterium]
RTGMAIGIFPVNRYEQRVVHLEPGDFIFAYTDGVTEAMNAQFEEFGDERLKALVLAHAHDSPAKISQAVQDAVNAYIGGSPQSDDITFGVVKRV